MSNELLPCPFCGGKAETDASSVSEFYGHEHQDYTIKCTKCGADMTVYTHSNKDGTPSRGYEFGCSCCNDIPAAAKAKWNTRPQQSTTAGYVMVPVEPTPDMLLAGKRTIKGAADCTEGEQAEYAYKQMIAAAPKAEQPAHDVASVPDGLVERLRSYIPDGDGHNSQYANDLSEAVELLEAPAVEIEGSKGE